MKWIVLSLALIVFMAPSSEVLASSKTEGVLTTDLQVKSKTFSANLKEGFHFNEKAPNGLTIDGKRLLPSKLSSRAAEFKDLPEKWSSGRASLYICDDGITFCEPNFIELKGPNPVSASSAETGNVQILADVDSEKRAVNEHGFIENDLAKAQVLAKKQNLLILADFSARWCPGCVRFETETFPTPAFRKWTRSLVKVKIDVDRFESSALSQKFNVKGIPALIVMTKDLEEVDRIVDYQSDETVAKFFDAIREDATPIKVILASKPKTLDGLSTSSARKASASNHRAGRRLLVGEHAKEANAFLEQTRPQAPELLTARVQLAKENPEVALLEAIAFEPTSFRSLAWRQSLIEALMKKSTVERTEITKILNEGEVLADRLLKDKKLLKTAVAPEPVGEFSGYEKILVASQKADLLEAAKSDAETIKTAWKNAAQEGLRAAIPTKKTGPSLRVLIFLNHAEMFAEADQLSLKLLKLDPGNPELQRRRLRALLGQKKFEDAIVLANEAIKKSYDRNEFWVAESLAKAYIGAGRIDDALLVLDTYLARPDIEWPTLKGTRKSMEELRLSARAKSKPSV